MSIDNKREKFKRLANTRVIMEALHALFVLEWSYNERLIQKLI